MTAERWAKALQEIRPELSDTYTELSALNPPPGRAAVWHFAQLNVWDQLLDAMEIFLDNLDTAEQRFIGEDEDNEEILISPLWDQSILAGKEADQRQVELVEWLAGPLEPTPTPEPTLTPAPLSSEQEFVITHGKTLDEVAVVILRLASESDVKAREGTPNSAESRNNPFSIHGARDATRCY